MVLVMWEVVPCSVSIQRCESGYIDLPPTCPPALPNNAHLPAPPSGQHIPITHFFIHGLGLGYVGAAYATVWSSLLATLLVAAYVRASNLHHRVWATPNGIVFQVGGFVWV